MITRNRYNLQGDTNYQGLSTDQKPRHGVAVNSLMIEFDTGNIYYAMKGSVDYPREEVLEETTFTAEATSTAGIYDYEISGVHIPTNGITVVFDGVIYDSSGAWSDDGPDFTDYPYALLFTQTEPLLEDKVIIMVPDDDEHTIEIYSEGYPAEWKKIGEKLPHILFEITFSDWEEYYGDSYWSEFIDRDFDPPANAIIEFDGVDYECTLQTGEEDAFYGAPWLEEEFDFSEYPFCIAFGEDETNFLSLYVQTDEPHTFKIKGE